MCEAVAAGAEPRERVGEHRPAERSREIGDCVGLVWSADAAHLLPHARHPRRGRRRAGAAYDHALPPGDGREQLRGRSARVVQRLGAHGERRARAIRQRLLPTLFDQRLTQRNVDVHRARRCVESGGGSPRCDPARMVLELLAAVRDRHLKCPARVAAVDLDLVDCLVCADIAKLWRSVGGERDQRNA